MSENPVLDFSENRGRRAEVHRESAKIIDPVAKNVGRVFDPSQTITNTHATEALVDDPLGNAQQSGQSQH